MCPSSVTQSTDITQSEQRAKGGAKTPLTLNPITLGLLLICYVLLGIALYWGHERGHSPEDIGTYVVFGSFLFILVTMSVFWIASIVGSAIGF
jgi:hypothetical protein